MSETQKLEISKKQSKTMLEKEITFSEEKKQKYREMFLGKANPRYGVKLTDEQKEKISISNKNFYKEHPEAKEKQSIERAGQWLDGKYNGVDFKTLYKHGHYFSTKNNKELYYRSGFEKTFFEKLDNDDTVDSFLSEPFSIPYILNDITLNYIPDLLIFYKDGTIKLVEIKPAYQLETEKNLAKFAAARQYCEPKRILFEVWSESSVS